MINKLIEILEIQRPTRDDKDIRAYLLNELATIQGVTVYENEGNIYATKGIAPYPCVVSHTDAVHKRTKGGIKIITHERKLFGINPLTMTQCNIGGDDGVGIFVCLQMLKEHDDIKVAFFRDEEVGCIGSGLVDKTWFDDVSIVLQCDRRGNSDFVTRASWTELSSKAFQDAVLPILTTHGYKFSDGYMTDVQELKEQGISASMANISCGYYNPHADNEFVSIDDVTNVISLVTNIIYELGATYYPHEYVDVDVDYSYEHSNWWDEKPVGLMQPPKPTGFHDGQHWCADCNMRPATGPMGFCDMCWDWYKKTNAKPDVKPDIHTQKYYSPKKIIDYWGRRKWKKK